MTICINFLKLEANTHRLYYYIDLIENKKIQFEYINIYKFNQFLYILKMNIRNLTVLNYYYVTYRIWKITHLII